MSDDDDDEEEGQEDPEAEIMENKYQGLNENKFLQDQVDQIEEEQMIPESVKVLEE